MAAGFDRSLGQAKIQEVGDGGEGGVVSAHDFGGGGLAAGIERDGANFLARRDVVDARSDFFSTLEIAVGESDGVDLRLPRHIERSGGAHHAGTDDEKFHGECLEVSEFRDAGFRVSRFQGFRVAVSSFEMSEDWEVSRPSLHVSDYRVEPDR